MALKVSFLSFVAGIGRKRIRFTNAEGKEQEQEQGAGRSEGRERNTTTRPLTTGLAEGKE